MHFKQCLEPGVSSLYVFPGISMLKRNLSGYDPVSIDLLLYIADSGCISIQISSAISKYVFTLQNQVTVCRLLVTIDSECAKTSSNGFLRSDGT